MRPRVPDHIVAQEPADVQVTAVYKHVGLAIFRDSGDASVYLTPDAARQIAIGLLDAATCAERPMTIVRDARRDGPEKEKESEHGEDAS